MATYPDGDHRGSFLQACSLAELPLTRPLYPALALANLSCHLLRSRQSDDLDVGVVSDRSDL
jgi:hypothetical protein